jgi:tetratricopeptide (TPR) repeat protein
MRGRKHSLRVACAVLVCGVGIAAAGQRGKRSATRKQTQRSPSISANSAQPPAENLFTSAIRANNLGIALMDRREFTEALGRFQTACVMNPASDTGCLNMGIALMYMRRLDDARNILMKSAQRDPQNPRAWFNLALLEKAQGQSGAALDDFEKVAALDPNDAATQYLIGAQYLETKEYPQAVASFRKAIDLDRLSLPAEFGIAQAEGQMGDIHGALEHLNRAEHLTEANLGSPASGAYGEQGKYSRAQEMHTPAEPAPAMIRVRFVNVTETSGLPWRKKSATTRASRRSREKQKAKEESPSGPDALGKFLGGGACVFDYDGDGRPDIYLADADGNGHPALFRNVGHGRFVDVTKASKLEFRGEVLGCATGDYANEGHADLAVGLADGVEVFHNNGDGTFTDATEAAGLGARGLVLGMTFVDYNGDGNLDLYAARFGNFPIDDPSQPFSFPADASGPGNLLWRGSERGAFTEVARQLGLAGSAPTVGAIGCDINNDGAIDIVATGWRASPTVYLNQREGSFRAVTPWSTEMPGPTAGAAALDFDHDGWMDLAFTHWSSPGLSLWRNVDGKSFERVPLPGPQWMRGWGLAAVDYDHDGWVDLVAVGEDFADQGHIILLRNEGGDGRGGFAGFRDVTHETGLDQVELHNPRSVIAFDADGDGTTDLLITQNGLPPVLLKGVGSDKNNSLQLGLTGNRDNRRGIGSKIEVFTGALRQESQIGGASGYLGQGPAEVTAGVGQDGGADVVRILWPSGIVQDEIDVLSGKPRTITENDRGPRLW